jgi:CBS domain-containing protein
MTPDPETVSEKDAVRDAARIMAKRDTGVVPVVDGKKVVGMITDRDIVVRLVAEGKDPGSARVHEAMTKNVRSVTEETPVDEVLQIMARAEVRRVPVVNGNNEITGIVSIGDIAVETNQHSEVGKVIEDISEARPNK